MYRPKIKIITVAPNLKILKQVTRKLLSTFLFTFYYLQCRRRRGPSNPDLLTCHLKKYQINLPGGCVKHPLRALIEGQLSALASLAKNENVYFGKIFTTFLQNLFF